MRTGLSKSIIGLARKHPALTARGLSILPCRLHRHWIVREMLRESAGSRSAVRTRLCNGMRLATFIGDTVGDEIYISGISERLVVRTLADLLNKQTLFFDIGAHVGQYTLAAAPLAREVHCFEPMPWIYRMLESNIRRNKLKNVIANRNGVRDYTGLAAIWEGPRENSGNGSFLRIPEYYKNSYPVECVTLDDYCEAKGLTPEVGKLVIKIDVERAELEVLRGAAWLFRYQPSIIVEFNDWNTDLEEIVSFFGDKNYTLRMISDQGFEPFPGLEEVFPQRRRGKVVNVLAQPRASAVKTDSVDEDESRMASRAS